MTLEQPLVDDERDRGRRARRAPGRGGGGGDGVLVREAEDRGEEDLLLAGDRDADLLRRVVADDGTDELEALHAERVGVAGCVLHRDGLGALVADDARLRRRQGGGVGAVHHRAASGEEGPDVDADHGHREQRHQREDGDRDHRRAVLLLPQPQHRSSFRVPRVPHRSGPLSRASSSMPAPRSTPM